MKKKYTGLLYITPWLVGFLVFTLYPFIMSFVLSFTDYNMISSPKFIGFQNYKTMFLDPTFKTSIVATFEFVILTVPLKLIFALIIAFILNFKLKAINFYRTAYYIPSILGGNIAIAVLWKFVFSTQGLVNSILRIFGIKPIMWFSSGIGAMIAISLLKVWEFGSAMIIFLAALRDIPHEYYEAASVDGAGKVRIFFKITVPLLTPVIFFNLVMGIIQSFQEFNAPYMVTQGGPLNKTYLTTMMIYDNAFKYYKMGYASAISWFLFVIILILTVVVFKTSNKWVYYSDQGGEN